MCELCRSYPCVSRCPNAREPKGKHTCSECGSPIYEDEKFLDTGRRKICKECLDDMDIETVLAEIGVDLEVA